MKYHIAGTFYSRRTAEWLTHSRAWSRLLLPLEQFALTSPSALQMTGLQSACRISECRDGAYAFARAQVNGRVEAPKGKRRWQADG
jgi:hypothetical protein